MFAPGPWRRSSSPPTGTGRAGAPALPQVEGPQLIFTLQYDALTETQLDSGSVTSSAQIIAALLRHGAAPDSPTNTQHTALFMATRYGHLACCFALLRAGASLAPRKLPSGNRSPADYVRTRRLVFPRRRRRDPTRAGRSQGRRGQLRRAHRRACATTEFVALRKHKYATLRELAAAVAAQYAVVAALFDAECLPDDAFACVASFWLGPRGYDAAPAPRPRLAMPSIELESSSSSA